MYSRNSFGSYYPVDSCIHRLNPIIKLINFIITIILLLATSSTHITLFMLVFVLIMMMLSYVPIKYYFNTFITGNKTLNPFKISFTRNYPFATVDDKKQDVEVTVIVADTVLSLR